VRFDDSSNNNTDHLHQFWSIFHPTNKEQSYGFVLDMVRGKEPGYINGQFTSNVRIINASWSMKNNKKYVAMTFGITDIEPSNKRGIKPKESSKNCQSDNDLSGDFVLADCSVGTEVKP